MSAAEETIGRPRCSSHRGLRLWLAGPLACLSACALGGTQRDTQKAALSIGSTSVCFVEPEGTTQRYDRVELLAGASSSNSDLVWVSEGAQQVAPRDAQIAFVAPGAFFRSETSSGHVLFLAPGASAALSGGEGHIVYVQAGATLDCGTNAAGVTVFSAAGAILLGCGATQERALGSFSICSPSSEVAQLFPVARVQAKMRAASGLNTVEVENLSSGTFSAVRWKLWRKDAGEKVLLAEASELASWSFSLPTPPNWAPGTESYRLEMRLEGPFPAQSDSITFDTQAWDYDRDGCDDRDEASFFTDPYDSFSVNSDCI